MIVDYPKKSEKLGTMSGRPEYGAGDKFPDNMESVQRYPRAEGMEHSDEARPQYAEPANMNPIEHNVCEYPRHDNGKTLDPYDPTVPMSYDSDTLDKRGRKADE